MEGSFSDEGGGDIHGQASIGVPRASRPRVPYPRVLYPMPSPPAGPRTPSPSWRAGAPPVPLRMFYFITGGPAHPRRVFKMPSP
eukprot:6382289-Pyramimonas_sp.AAC.1